MSLQTGDKAIICRKYDSILNGIRPINAYMKHPYYPNLINFDENYKTDEETKHERHSILLSQEIGQQLNKESEEILEYIQTPDFYPDLTTYNRTLKQERASLEDTILYRNVSDIFIMDESPIEENIRISHCYLMYLSKNITYLAETTLLIPINVFNLLEKIVKKNIEEGKITGNFIELLWSEIEKRRFKPQTFKNNTNFLSKYELDQYMGAKYGYSYKNNWRKRGIFKLDNRRFDPDQEKQITLIKTFMNK